MATRKTSTAVAVKSTTNVVAIQDAARAIAASISERIMPGGGPKILLKKDKTFVLPDGTKTPGPLELVIVDFVTTHNFYDTKFDEKNPMPPGCFAVGTNPKQMFPIKASPNIQNDNCQDCPLNAFGSDGGNGKVCRNGRKLAVLPPDADADTPLWIIEVSPTAIRGFDGYVAAVVRAFGMAPFAVVTTVSMNEASEYQQLVFSDPKPNDNLGVAHARLEEARALLVTEPDFSRYTGPGKSAARPAKRATTARR